MKRLFLPILILALLTSCNRGGTTSKDANPTAEASETGTFKPENIQEQLVYNGAVEAVIWGIPAVNYELMYQAMVRETKGGSNQIVYWSNLISWKNQTLTPNPDAIYLMPFFSTKEAGPMVLEIPAANDEGSITGNIDDVWQAPLEDVGPAGIDGGKGGKCLILPPDYKGKIPAGYIPLSSETSGGYALLRSILKTGGNDGIAKAVAYGKRIKLYPLSQANNPPETIYRDAIDVVFDATIPYDLHFFESLNRIVQNEPWLERDKVMIDKLRAIGIEKGKPFTPDARMQALLNAAAGDAKKWLTVQYETVFEYPFFKDTRWAIPALPHFMQEQSTHFANPDIYPVQDRGVTYSYGFVGIKRLGAGGGQAYLMSIKDKEGNILDGNKTYHLKVPAHVPINQYWSATVYDRETHALIRDAKILSRSSLSPGLQVNDDGSVDLYFGGKAPAGKESNWVESGKGNFEVLFRFYGPEKALFEKTWTMGDIETMK